MFVTAVLNLVLSIILGKWLGVSGIIFATSISKLLTYFWYEPNILFKNFFKVKPYNYYLDYLKNSVLMAICIGLCFILFRRFTNVSIITWIIKAIICSLVVNILYYVRYHNSSEYENIKNRILSTIKRD